MSQTLDANAPFTVHGMASSGNCHKVKLVLDLLQLPYHWNEVDILKGETRTLDYLALNPNGKVPVLQIGANTALAESNAIVCYLADGTTLWPAERLARAQTLQWMFFEQYSHEPYVAVARFIRAFLKRNDDPRLPEITKRGYAALDVMEQHLQANPFFVGGQLTIADIALFAYTHKADEGGFDLARYRAICAWLARVRTVPGVTDAATPL